MRRRIILQIAALLKPLIRPGYKFKITPGSKAASLPLLGSHLGGWPYLETGEAWPSCSLCKMELRFICQLDLTRTAEAPLQGVDLLTFFTCLGCDYSPPGWACREYRDPSAKNAIPFSNRKRVRSKKRVPRAKPGRLRLFKGSGTEVGPCRVNLIKGLSLPDWPGIEVWSEKANRLSIAARLNDNPSEAYNQAVKFLIGEGESHYSDLGGYPYRIQGDDTPRCRRCKRPMKLLLTVGSGGGTNLNWVDAGAVYLFFCARHPGEKELVEQFF